jgi:hypothetical protein
MTGALRLVLATIVTGMLAVAAGLSASPAAASGAVPYHDPAAVGDIGLCNKAGQQITHGDLNASPLAWRAVSSVAATAPYNGPGRTATLFAYQPRQGLAPGEWSGEALTASSRYSNPAHPMVAATSGDDSLADFDGDFHPAWDDLVQLRIYLGAPNNQPETFQYPALTLKVTGNTWHAVDGGSVSCHSGTSESIETILLHPSTTPKPAARAHPEKGASAKANGSAKPSNAGQSTGPAASTAPSTSEAANSSSSSSSSHGGLIALLIVIAGLVVAAAIYLFLRRRQPAPAAPASPPTDDHSTKGQS